jgi:hypothetical protein
MGASLGCHDDVGWSRASMVLGALGNYSRTVRTTTLVFVFSVLLLGGCASDRSSEQHPPKRTFFDSPDVESLH